MEEERKESLVSLILCGLCVLLTTISGVLAILEGKKQSVIGAISTVLSPVLWTATFVLKLVDFCAGEQEEE